MLDRKRWNLGMSSRFHIDRPLRTRQRLIGMIPHCLT
jgi:hypothetical protein